MVYDAPSNQFLPGNHVVLTDRATQCLSDFSVDFERSSVLTEDGPDMTVESVTVNGRPAPFRFVQPTYPGDPNGQDDPDPRAHQASQVIPVGGPDENPLPPACSPQVTGDDVNAQNGEPCPANKLVVTPQRPLRKGEVFQVSIAYTGRPGVHLDGDGSTEGWFRSDDPPGDGSFVTTEPVGTEAWMPLNNHPRAKPTYDFYDTVTRGRTAIANGQLLSTRSTRPTRTSPAARRRSTGAPVHLWPATWSKTGRGLRPHLASGLRRHPVLPGPGQLAEPRAKQANLTVMDQQQDINTFQSQFNGPFPFASNGVLVGIPTASFEEEMQTMITFNGGEISLGTFNHENMHQWWGDNVSEGNFNLTFFKEGMATLGQYLFHARNAQTAAGDPARRRGMWPSSRAWSNSSTATTPTRAALDGGALGPDTGPPVRQHHDVHPARNGLHRAAADPRAGQVQPGTAEHPAELRRR